MVSLVFDPFCVLWYVLVAATSPLITSVHSLRFEFGGNVF